MYNDYNIVYLMHGKVAQTRLHMMFEAPPGYGKSLMLTLFGNDQVGIFQNSGIQMMNQNYMTGAGLVGTVRTTPEGDTVQTAGVASVCKRGIVMIDEFNGMVQAMNNTSMNGEMKPQLLTLLDSGDVSKQLGPGGFRYHSWMTLWTGIQPMKSDLADGLGRRLCFLLNLPTGDTRQKYKDARKEAALSTETEYDLDDMHSMVNDWITSISLIQRVEFSNEFETFLDEVIDAEHYEFDIYERIALGFTIVKYGASKSVTIKLTDDIKQIVLMEADWRWKVKREPRIQSILEIIRTHGLKTPNGMSLSKIELIDRASHMELDSDQVNKVLSEAVSAGYISIRGKNICMEENAMVCSPYMIIAKEMNIEL